MIVITEYMNLTLTLGMFSLASHEAEKSSHVTCFHCQEKSQFNINFHVQT